MKIDLRRKKVQHHSPGRNGVTLQNRKIKVSVMRRLLNRVRPLTFRPDTPLTQQSKLERPTSALCRVESDHGQHIPAFVERRISEIMDRQTASKIFYRYLSDMAFHLPVVVFPSGTTADEVRSSKPILFLSILVAASVGMTDLKKQHDLAQVLMGAFADRVIRFGDKSLCLIQALLVATIWYRPPKRYEQMNFYQLSHIAAVMAIDIGMGKKLNASKHKRMHTGGEHALGNQYLANTDSVEARRTWLGCYFQCAQYVMGT